MSDQGREQDAKGEPSLDTKIMRSSAWSALSFGGANILQFIAMLFLARLLRPDDFGVVAIVYTLLAVLALAQESGLGAALIYRRHDLPEAAASASVFAPLVGVALFGACLVVAPWVADAFDTERLTAVFRVMALLLVIRGFAVVPMAILQREMLFGHVAKIELATGVTQAGTAVALAFAGAGVWSLVIAQLAAAALQVGLSWALTPLRPVLAAASWRMLRELMRYGRHVGAANILNFGNNTVDALVVGRVLGTTPLGYYQIAGRLAGMPVQVIGNIAGRGVFPAFASLQGDIAGFKRVWIENVQRIALLSVPASVGVIIAAEPIVLALLGDDWRPAITPLRILGLLGFVKVFAATSGEVFQALGRPQLRLYIEIAHIVLIVPAIVVLAEAFDLTGVAVAIVLVNTLTGIPALVIIMRALSVRPLELARAIGPSAAGWALLAAVLLALVPAADHLPPGLGLGLLAVAGLVVYGAATAVFARGIVATMWLSLRGARSLG